MLLEVEKAVLEAIKNKYPDLLLTIIDVGVKLTE